MNRAELLKQVLKSGRVFKRLPGEYAVLLRSPRELGKIRRLAKLSPLSERLLKKISLKNVRTIEGTLRGRTFKIDRIVFGRKSTVPAKVRKLFEKSKLTRNIIKKDSLGRLVIDLKKIKG